jgi:hypothetical protein
MMTSSPLAQENSPVFIKKMEPSIVMVLAYDQEGRTLQQGGGFFVGNDGDIITHRDILEGADHADARTKDGMLYPVRKVLAEDKELNLIKIWAEIPSGAVHPLSITSSLPQLGERVALIVGVSGHEKTSYGTVSALQEIPAFGKIIRVTAPLSSRFNASPVVNMKGEMIGVVTSWIVEGQRFSFIVPTERVVRLKGKKAKDLNKWEAERADEAERLYANGLSFLLKEDYKKALPSFMEVVKKNPRFANAYFQIGYCNAQLGRYGEALEAYKKAIGIDPDFVLAHFFLGLIYLEVRDRNHALGEFKILEDLDRNYANDLLNMIQ